MLLCCIHGDAVLELCHRYCPVLIIICHKSLSVQKMEFLEYEYGIH